MFGSLGYWASSKGMVAVPNLSGLTEAQASTALSNALLSYTKTTNTQTANNDLVGKVATQSVAAGSLANYESVIEISIYEYFCIPTWGSWYDIGSPYDATECQSNNTYTYKTQQRRDSSNCGSQSETRETTVTASCVYSAATFVFSNGGPPYVPPGATTLSSGGLFLINGQSQNVTTSGCGVQTVGPAWTTGGWYWVCYQR
jgi:hypothetical protein